MRINAACLILFCRHKPSDDAAQEPLSKEQILARVDELKAILERVDMPAGYAGDWNVNGKNIPSLE